MLTLDCFRSNGQSSRVNLSVW